MEKIGLGALALLTAFLAYVALQNPHFEVSRSVVINAPVEKVFPYLHHSRLAEQWGPWAEVDPTAKLQYSGPESGVGARTFWEKAKQLGTGSATIVAVVPNRQVDIQLEYTEPQSMRQLATYLVEPQGAQTRVTWKVTGENTFVGRLMCTVFNMDKMVGGFFELGLAKLKIVAEKA